MHKKAMYSVPFVLFLAMFFFVLAPGFTCSKRTESPVIARVGRDVLTLDDLYERIPPGYSDHITRGQKINYVRQWVDTELLFQEALRQKIHREQEIRERLAKMKKDLLSAEIISRYTFNSAVQDLPEEAVAAYYEENRESFLRETDVIKYMEIVVDNLKAAWNVRNMVTPDNFLDLAVRFSMAPVQDPRAFPYVPFDAIHPAISSVARNIRVNGASSPIEVDGFYHVVKVLDKQEAGTVCTFEEVRDEIFGKLSTEAQKIRMDEFLSDLRLRADHEFHFDLIPVGDSGYKDTTTG